jgi:hypothetical protein
MQIFGNFYLYKYNLYKIVGYAKIPIKFHIKYIDRLKFIPKYESVIY